MDAGFDAPASIIEGEVETVLCDYRADHNIDMLIMGAYGHSMIRRFLVGSTTTNVIRNASVPRYCAVSALEPTSSAKSNGQQLSNFSIPSKNENPWCLV